MKKSDLSYIKISYLLTYLGVIPFAFFALAWVLEYDLLFEFKLYSVLILSFLGGINWGIGIRSQSAKLILYSVFPSIFGWVLFLINSNLKFLVALILLFMFQLLADYKIFKAGMIEGWFFKLRIQATSIVILSIILAICGVI